MLCSDLGGQIDLFQTYLYLIGPCVKNKTTQKKQLHKNDNLKHHERDSLISKHKIILDELTCC